MVRPLPDPSNSCLATVGNLAATPTARYTYALSCCCRPCAWLREERRSSLLASEWPVPGDGRCDHGDDDLCPEGSPCAGRSDAVRSIRVAIFERHAVVREGLVALIGQCCDVTIAAEADASDTACDVVVSSGADVAVLGIGRPSPTGYARIRTLANAPTSTPIVVLADFGSGHEIGPAIEAGARGFVSKTCGSNVFVEGIRSVYEGRYFMGPLVTDLFLRSLLDAERATGGAHLTRREHEVLRLIGQGHTDREIAVRLGLSAKTVHTYRVNVMTKLGVRNVGMLVRRAMELGLIAS